MSLINYSQLSTLPIESLGITNKPRKEFKENKLNQNFVKLAASELQAIFAPCFFFFKIILIELDQQSFVFNCS